MTESITFVILVNDIEVYENNFLASPLFKREHCHEIFAMRGFSSAAKGLNAAIDRARNDLIVFAHQDIFFPGFWISDLEKALRCLGKHDSKWGVLGCFGVTKDNKSWGFVYSTGLGVLGKEFAHPMTVQTLDEIVLVIRRSSGLRFDDSLPHFHLYGTDICLRAERNGKRCYAISAFCLHNTYQIINLPKEFWVCYKYLKRQWKDFLPIQTPCIRISKFDSDVIETKLREVYGRILGKERRACARVSNPGEIVERLITDKQVGAGNLGRGNSKTLGGLKDE